ncbi:MAG: cell division protein FtsQ/DivIB [Rhodoferax sp.]|nr:cell division protein FtsQ/DivIB [Rhodoferax sp.]
MKTALPMSLDIRLMNLSAVGLLLAFAGLCAFYAVQVFSRLAVFDIQGISVNGDTRHNSSVTLRANVTPRIDGTILTVDLARVRAAFEAAPWVRQAQVWRDFPNRLRVSLQEHQPVALWGGADGAGTELDARLLNSYGEVFEANLGEVDQDELPLLSGPDGEGPNVLAMYHLLAPRFAELGLKVEAVNLSARGSWSVRLENAASIELGRGDAAKVQPRLDRFLKTLTQVVSRYGRQPSALEAADLRHENGYAIRLYGVSTTATVAKQ